MANDVEIIVATLNVSFGDEQASKGALKLEIDDRPEGLNDGNTSFKPGDEVAFFRFMDDNIQLITQQATSGAISAAGQGTKEIDENISFSNSNTASLGYPPDGVVTMKWLGRAFEITKTGTVSPFTGRPAIEGMELEIPGGKNVAGVLNCKYSSTGDLFKIKAAKDILELMIIAIGRAN